MSTSFTVVGLGEALFDVFPDQQVLGGAPLNVAVHAHQLASARSGRGVVVSRVGQDALGERMRQELAERGMAGDYIQADPDHATGQVYVRLDEQGQPDYQIVEDVAWDWLQWDGDLNDLARQCNAVCFSSLSQRHGQARSVIQRFLAEAKQAIRLFDLTLRQHYYDRGTLATGCELATVVKLNLEELDVLCQVLGMAQASVDDRAGALLKRFDLGMVVVTRGKGGTVLYTPTTRYEGAAASVTPSAGADSVGAGDGCAAAILVALVLRLPMQAVADLANEVGAYMASVPGATTALPDAIVARIKVV